jgi:hypothetical protein
MARLDNASLLRWPRRIMVSMTSLRNRLAEAPAPSSPAPLKVLPGDLERILEELGERDGHGQKTNENRSRSLSSPLRRSHSYLIATGSDRMTTSPNTWASGVSRASQTAKRGFRQSRPHAICRASSSSVSPATPSPVA